MSQQTEIRKLIRTLRKQGADVRRTTNHWQVFTSEGKFVLNLPTHASRDGGATRANGVAMLRRAGFKL